jgi:hypothetical protein
MNVRLQIVVLVLGCLVIGPLFVRGGDGKEGKAVEDEGALKKALLEHARKTYELTLRGPDGDGGMGSAEACYRWSRRWLEAQLGLAHKEPERGAAYRDHLTRMKELEQRAKALWQVGKLRPADLPAASFYRTEAELWLTQPKKGRP